MALNDIAPSFIWGANGSKLTPEQIATLQAIEAKRSGGIDVSPVQSWTQGAARVADAIAGAFRRGSLDKAEKENTSYNSSLISDLIGGGAPAASTVPMSGAGAEVSATNPDPIAEVLTAGGNPPSDTNWLRYDNSGATRSQPLNEKLVGALGFLPELGVSMDVFSGGQPTAAEGGPRTGSDRHDHGNAADVFFSKGGRRLDWANPDDVPVFQEIVKRGKAAGITGFGAGDGYMQPGSMHLGFGSNAVWGAGGRGANAPEWLRAAYGSAAAPDQVASAAPRTATDAIASYAPQQSAPALPPATVVPNAPQVAAQPPVAVPPQQQVAQAITQPSAPAASALNPAIVKALTDPRANPGTRAVAEALMRQQQAQAQAILEQRLKQSDPGYQADMRLKNLQADQIANPRISPTDQANIDLNRDKFGFEKESSALTPDIKEYNFAKQNGYNGSFAQYQIDLKRAAAANTTINNGEGNKFYNTLDEKNATVFSNLSDAGIQGRSKLAQIDQLDKLLQSSGTGAMAVLKQRAGDLGINTEGLSDIQAASALISKMIPAQREPGSGPVSDADLAGFRNSLPRLINQPGGNATIINTIRGLTQYQIAQGEIADKVANREITPAEGRQQIANLPNPLANFKPPEPGQEDQGWRELSPGVRVRKVQ